MPESRSNGIVVGVVTDLADPQNLGRVRMQFPHLGGETSDWARLATTMAGKGRGTFFRPEVGDEVLVGFEHGDPRRPYVLGALWNQQDQPPTDDGEGNKNNWRFIQSRSGHIIKLDDKVGAERIELIDKDGQRRVVIDSANSKIQVICQQGDVEVSAPTGTVSVKAQSITVEADLDLTLKANGTVKIEGRMVNIN